MSTGRTAPTTAGWRRWLLALTLCLFAFGYGAPASLAAHATGPHAAMTSGCPEGAGHGSEGGVKPVLAACCIAHCLPAMPGSVPPSAEMPAISGPDARPRDEVGEGWSAPVLLPPPRA